MERYVGDIKDFIEFLNNKGVEFNGYVLFEGLNNLTNKLILFKTHEQNDLLYENDCSIINK
ncbi:hypothetical protein SDC9_100885 [bioreactor metagenome]|uniref:Uncharacterized protein n=1 Tax=bioreactor metagenome TaxID=1076179 RepID=A0A645ALK1_9ZZZZ